MSVSEIVFTLKEDFLFFDMSKKFKVDKNTVKIGAGVNWNEAVFKTIKRLGL